MTPDSETMNTHVRTGGDSIKDVPGKRVLAKVCDDVTCPRGRHDSAKDAFDLVPPLLDCMDVAFRWAALEARTYHAPSAN